MFVVQASSLRGQDARPTIAKFAPSSTRAQTVYSASLPQLSVKLSVDINEFQGEDCKIFDSYFLMLFFDSFLDFNV